MATRTIARLFDSSAEARSAVHDLEAAGFAHDDMSLVARDGEDGRPGDTSTDSNSGAGTGATLGTLVGGGAGLLAGIGALAVPGLGPIVAAGWLVAALTGAGVGAAAGGLLGGLTSAGISEEHAEIYAEGVRRGGHLVTLRVAEARVMEAEAILTRHGAVDTHARAEDWRQSGWAGGDSSLARSAGTDSPDAAPGNPPGTALGRAADRALGTNMSGAHPENEANRGVGVTPDAPDGTPGNPAGTRVSRGVDDALGTNVSGARPKPGESTVRRNPSP
jgi:hypothetical protein